MIMDVNFWIDFYSVRVLFLILFDLSLDENLGGIQIKGVDVINSGGRVNIRGDRMRIIVILIGWNVGLKIIRYNLIGLNVKFGIYV